MVPWYLGVPGGKGHSVLGFDMPEGVGHNWLRGVMIVLVVDGQVSVTVPGPMNRRASVYCVLRYLGALVPRGPLVYSVPGCLQFASPLA